MKSFCVCVCEGFLAAAAGMVKPPRLGTLHRHLLYVVAFGHNKLWPPLTTNLATLGRMWPLATMNLG